MKILFLCTGNSCRSQMAEGWARHLKSGLIEAHSAGVQPRGLDPYAVRVMAEAGVDIASHHAKRVEEVRAVRFDYVVTVCEAASGSCPGFSGGTQRLHKSFDDPPSLALDARTEEEALHHYRRVRDEIRALVQTLPEALPPLCRAGPTAPG